LDAGNGREIADLPTTTELTGVDNGTTTSGVASNGKSRDERHGSGSGASARATTSNGGGTGTPDTASANKSYPGTSAANEASGGHSAAGSGNVGSGLETAKSASNERAKQIAPVVDGSATQDDAMASG
jgi:hypothetical protein